ncbi:MAG TPA: ThuA domain-containing protein, partial [Clostridia bacterium]|nr:ThuA domain-containing protein [Clostridia bacterium]
RLKHMKLISLPRSGALLWAGVLAGLLGVSQIAEAAGKKVLVVTTTTGFRHSSIPTAEKVLGELAAQSKDFIVEYARVEPNDPQFRGPDGKPVKAKVDEAIEKVLAEKMSAAALKTYDAIIFANTTGDLPVPDKAAFLEWIKSGKGFVGMHSATDTFHGYPEFIEMIGGEFKSHGAQVEVEAINQDQSCPACRHLGETWKVYDEIYLFKNFDASKVHGLLTLDKQPNDKTPGNYPVAWCKEYGKGRVFYTSLGHREDIWDANTPADFKRMNSKEIALAYQQHILGGIKWALGMEGWKPKALPRE